MNSKILTLALLLFVTSSLGGKIQLTKPATMSEANVTIPISEAQLFFESIPRHGEFNSSMTNNCFRMWQHDFHEITLMTRPKSTIEIDWFRHFRARQLHRLQSRKRINWEVTQSQGGHPWDPAWSAELASRLRKPWWARRLLRWTCRLDWGEVWDGGWGSRWTRVSRGCMLGQRKVRSAERRWQQLLSVLIN